METTKNVGADAQATQKSGSNSSANSQKTFTEQEVNKIVAERLARAKKQTASQMQKNESNWKQNVVQMQNQLANYEKELALSKYQIADEYRDFVNYKVLRNVSKDKSYATALKEFMDSEGARYGANQITNQPRPRNSNTIENAKSNNDLRKLFGLKPKN